MRIGDSMPPRLQAVASVFWGLGIALNLVLAVSSIWGWHPFLGWGASIVLLTLVWDERRAIRAAVSGRGRTADKLFAYCLVLAAMVALLVNTALALGAV